MDLLNRRDAFETALSETHAASTVFIYLRELEKLSEWLTENRPETDWKQVEIEDVEEYLRHKNTGEADYNRSLVSLRKWFNFLLELEAITTNPASLVETAYPIPSGPTGLSLEDFTKFADAAAFGQGMTPHRNFRLVVFLYGTGLRTAELLALTLDDVWAWKQGKLGDTIVVRSRPEGRKQVYLAPVARRCLGSWLAEAHNERVLDKTNPKQHVWVKTHGKHKSKPMTQQALRETFKTISEKAGMDRVVTPQTLRKTFERYLRKADVPKAECECLMGRASPDNLYSTHEFKKNNIDFQVLVDKIPNPWGNA